MTSQVQDNWRKTISSQTYLLIFFTTVVFLYCPAHLYASSSSSSYSSLSSSSSSSSSSSLVESPLRYKIQEEVPRGTFVADIVRDSGLRDRYRTDVISTLEFKILSPPPLPFIVDGKTGIVRTDGVVDRDSLMMCKDRSICEVTLDIAVRPAQYFHIIKVAIEIDDINDNAPHYREQYTIMSIRESTSVGSSFALSPANDLDSPRYGVQLYELKTDTPSLGLSVITRRDGSADPRLVVLDPGLDRETWDRYHLQLVAFDGGVPPKSASLDVIVNVLDSNDNSPVFAQSSYSVNVSENVAIGTVLLRVKATDRDVGLNAEVSYRLSAQTLHLYGHLFSVDNKTGDIVVRGVIDYEKHSVYQLGVIAQDHGADSLPADASVVLRVQDVNDNAPTISVNTLVARRTNSADVMENLVAGSFVAHVSVSDLDEGVNGRVTCNLTDSSTVFRLVERYATEYQLLTTRPLDRELVDRHDVNILCFDGGTPQSTTQYTLPVTVRDANDNAPTFANLTYTGHLMENNYLGAAVLRVTATDADVGVNADVHYVIAPLPYDPSSAEVAPSSVPFEVDASGVIAARTRTDRERQALYRFLVLAVDHGLPSLTSSATVAVIVDDVNDEPPAFSHAAYSFSVEENLAEGTVVGTVSADDRDLADSSLASGGGLRYSLAAADLQTRHKFTIEGETGNIYTTGHLDRESQAVFRLTVHVTDQGQPPLSATASVTVYVQDRNDNEPSCTYPSPLNQSLHVSAHLPSANVIARLVCHDPDLELNSLLRYHFKSDEDATVWEETKNVDPWEGSEHFVFAIDPDTGEISTKVPLDDDFIRPSYLLRIVVADSGTTVRSVSVSLTVHINASIPFGVAAPEADAQVATENVILAAGVVCGSGVLTVLLIALAALGRRRHRRSNAKRYQVRMEALKALTAKEAADAVMAERTPLTEEAVPGVTVISSGTIGNAGCRPSTNGGSYITLPSKCNGDLGSVNGSALKNGSAVGKETWKQRGNDCRRQQNDKKVSCLKRSTSTFSAVTSQSNSNSKSFQTNERRADADNGVEGHIVHGNGRSRSLNVLGRGPSPQRDDSVTTASSRAAHLPPPPPPPAATAFFGRLTHKSNVPHSVSGAGRTLDAVSTARRPCPQRYATGQRNEGRNNRVFFSDGVAAGDRLLGADAGGGEMEEQKIGTVCDRSTLPTSHGGPNGHRISNGGISYAASKSEVWCCDDIKASSRRGAQTPTAIPQQRSRTPTGSCPAAGCSGTLATWNTHPDGYIV